jgi:glutaredoxin
MKGTHKIVIAASVGALIVGGALFTFSGSGETDENVALAQCLTDQGVKMYGAWWCPHCKDQKDAFGRAAFQRIDYVECAVPGDTSAQNATCKRAGIEGYPTWEFADGSRRAGNIPLDQLAEQADCQQPKIDS